MGAEVLALGLLAFLLTYWLHSTLLLGLAWLVTRRLPASSASLREGLWRVALFGGFITAGVQFGLGVEPPLGRWVLRPAVAVETAQLIETAALEAPDVIGTGVLGTGAALPLHSAASRELWATAKPHERRSFSTAAGGWTRASEPVSGGARESGRSQWMAPRTEPLLASPSREPAPDPTHLGSQPAPQLLAGIGTTPGELPTSASFTRWVAGGWIGAVMLAALGLAACSLRLRRGLAGKLELTEGPLLETLARLNTTTGLRPAPRLFVAPRIIVPLCTGLWRPAICIPPRALRELSSAEQEAMLAHELGHLVRRDPLWTCLTWAAQNVFFFQPLNRLARRELLATAELLADDWATRATGERLSLASCLTRIAGWLVGERQQLLAPQMTRSTGAGRSHLGVRVERLLAEDETPLETHRRWLAPAACASLASLTLVVPGFAAVGTEVSAPTDEGAPLAKHFSAPAVHAHPRPAERAEPTEETAPAEHTEPVVPPWRLLSPVDPQLASELTELDQEVMTLERELAQFREHFVGVDLDPSVQRAVSELERRVRELADRRGRVNSVVWEATPPGIRP